MKTIYQVMMIASVLSLSVMSCTKENIKVGTGLHLSVASEDNYTTKATAAVDVNTFSVNIRKNTGEFDRTWTYGTIPSMIELSEGSFTVGVQSPEQEPVAWNQPIYKAEQTFEIVQNAITNLKLVCTIQNMKVTIEPSAHFIESVKDYNIVVSNEDGSLVWDHNKVNEKAEGFFSIKPLVVQIRGVRILDNSEAVREYKINTVAARNHHIIKIDAVLTGQAGLQIEVDDTLNDKPVDITVPGFEDVVPGGDTPGQDIGGGDEPVQPTVQAPTIEWPAHPDFPVLDITEGMDVNLIVKAPGKIKSFVVEVSENFQSAISMIASNPYLDLINDQTAITNLADVAPNLPTGTRLAGKTEVQFPLSDLIPLISGVGVPGEDYVFTLKVDDEAGNNLTKSLKFHLAN